MSCPDPSALRLAAEGADPAAAAHAGSCERCGRLLVAAAREATLLREALEATPPPGALDAALAAVAAEQGAEAARPPGGRARPPSGRSPGRRAPRPAARGDDALPRVLLGLLLGLFVAALLLLGGRASTPPAPPRQPPPTTTPPPPPRRDPTPPPRPATDPGPATEPGPAPGTEEELVTAQGPETDAPPPPSTDAPPGSTDAPPASTDAPPPRAPRPPDAPPPGTRTTPAAAFATLRAGKLAPAGGAPLAVGDPLPAGVALDAGPGGAEVELAGCAAVALAPRARVGASPAQAAPGAEAGVEVELLKGSLAIRTAGTRPWALVTPEARITPVGTLVVATRDGTRTRLTTLEGAARLAPAGGGDEVVVRAGFEAEATKGRAVPAPRPLAARELAWLPQALRPARPVAAPELLLAFDFEDGQAWTKGTLRAGGARGSRAALLGAPATDTYAAVAELERPGAAVFTLQPELWIEAHVRVDRAARVVLQVWDVDRKENLAHMQDVPAGRWTSIAAPLRAFGDASGRPRPGPFPAGDRATSLAVFAGERGQLLELLVDDVRVWRER